MEVRLLKIWAFVKNIFVAKFNVEEISTETTVENIIRLTLWVAKKDVNGLEDQLNI